jgi:DNA replication and repair protein RecF
VHLDRLWLTDFRSYTSAELTPAPDGLTVVLGANGQGKTNLLEAIGYLATLRSFRGVPGEALIRIGAARAVVRAETHRDGREVLIEAELVPTGRDRVQVNRQTLRRTRDLLGSFQVTVFSPDDVALVKAGPAGRRQYLDDLLVALHPRHDATQSEVDKVLRQRNALLKSVAGTRHPSADVLSTLDVWDEKLATAGEALVTARDGLTRALEPLADTFYARLADAGVSPASGDVGPDGGGGAAPLGGVGADADGSALAKARPEERMEPTGACKPAATQVSAPQKPGVSPRARLAYMRSWSGSLRDALVAARADDLRRGLTTVGPHRDELDLQIESMPARTHASQGEQRSLALALRLAGHRVVTDRLGTPPVLLLDDVFSELDDDRAAALVASLPPGQTLLTTAGHLPPGATPEVTCRLEAGRLMS